MVLSNIAPVVVAVITGFFLFQFFYWRRLKEDYSSALLFSSGLYLLAGLVSGSVVFLLLSNLLKDSVVFVREYMWFWGAILGSFFGFLLSVRNLHIKFFESFEASSVGLILWFALVNLGIFFVNHDKLAIFNLITSILLIFGFYYFESKYRKFVWYKSGRVGFSGLVTLFLFFLFRIPAVLVLKGGFSYVGKVDVVISAVCVFLCAFSLYNLSEDF